MKPVQTRIFVPPAPPYNQHCWVENVVATIIKPLIDEFKIEKFWFTRYGEDRQGSSGDTDLSKIPANFEHNGFWRSVRFRLWIDESQEKGIELKLKDLVSAAQCAIADLRHYPDIDDLAWARFCGDPYTQERREERNDLMRDFLCSSARLFIHMISGPNANGEYRLEHNGSQHNPQNNTFQSIHHLFCNMTEVPLKAMIKLPISVGTQIYPPSDNPTIVSMDIKF